MNFVPSQPLYDFGHYSLNTVISSSTKPPPLPSMSTHPLHLASVEKSTPTQSNSIGSRKIYSTSGGGAINTVKENLYGQTLSTNRSSQSLHSKKSTYASTTMSSINVNSFNTTTASNSGAGHHHHYYYYPNINSNQNGTNSTKIIQHYGTVQRIHSVHSAQKTHYGPNGLDCSSNKNVSNRFYQHYYPLHNHSIKANDSNQFQQHHNHHQYYTNQSRHHHSSHPQLLDSQAFSVSAEEYSDSIRSAITDRFYASTIFRRHTSSVYEPIGSSSARVPITSNGHFGYALENAGHTDSIYYSARSEIPIYSDTLDPLDHHHHRLHHSNSFHGHLDDLTLLDSNGNTDSIDVDGVVNRGGSVIGTSSRASRESSMSASRIRNDNSERELSGTNSESGTASTKHHKHTGGSSGWV
ncbi:hypothetical protein QR98_0045720 [Sarcoptes scabiei]|nr:hypothetical protein QR98_0045720 [Sarcoptes scabiei]